MEVKTGNLRNNLSRYLKRVRLTGDKIVVLDRDKPVAEIRPYHEQGKNRPTGVWERRKEFEAEDGTLNEDLELPERHTTPRKRDSPLD